MKIKYIFSISIFLLYFWAFAQRDCSELTKPEKSFVKFEKCSFWEYYNVNLCREFQPITKEAKDYIQSIKKMQWKSPQEMVTEIWNIFCRWSFWPCWETSFYDRYKKSCKLAEEKSIQDAIACKWWNPENKNDILTIMSNDESFKISQIQCEPLVENLLQAFKDVSGREIAKYHKKMIESSSEKYLVPARDFMQNLLNTMGTVVKKIWTVARSFEGFIRRVYDTWYTINNGH
jgi:hypothetical protein